LILLFTMRFPRLLGLWAVTPLLALAATPARPTSLSPGTVIAQINGQPITLGEFESQRAEKLFQAQHAYYQAERKVLDEFIGQALLAQQAQREHCSVDELLARHVNATLPPDPPEEALRVYYEGLDTTQPFEAVREQIVAHLRQRRREKAQAAYIQSLREQAKVVVSLAPPKAEVELKDTPVRGAAQAAVTVVEFADYECPYCQQVNPDLQKLEAEYKGKLAFAYKDTPLPSHTHAEKAAEAARCAGVQGKYWEYHDLLFASKQYQLADLKRQARQLQLDGAAFDQCLDSGAQAGAVKAQLAEFEKFGLTGTPSFFINGRFLSGAADYATLRGIVEQELAAAGTTKESSPQKGAASSAAPPASSGTPPPKATNAETPR
jgi:protein-disulfide isomerase